MNEKHKKHVFKCYGGKENDSTDDVSRCCVFLVDQTLTLSQIWHTKTLVPGQTRNCIDIRTIKSTKVKKIIL